MAVRFGIVLGSSDSVIPKLEERIARCGPLGVTHPDIIRCFMIVPEAARLVLQAAAIGDSWQLLVLDMGEPLKIVDLARYPIRMAGHSPDVIASEFTGLRLGRSSTRNRWPMQTIGCRRRCRACVWQGSTWGPRQPSGFSGCANVVGCTPTTPAARGRASCAAPQPSTGRRPVWFRGPGGSTDRAEPALGGP